MTAEEKDRPTYDEDFYAWSQDQAKHLRAQASLRRNEPLDWMQLAEEVEDLGKSELHACESLTQQIIAHLLKLQLSRASDPRAGWESEVAIFRIDLEQKLTPSIRRRITQGLDRQYARALRRLKALISRHEPAMLEELPTACPYTFDQILSPEDWLPSPGAPDT